MMYTTGSRDDWDYINRITGDPAWSWDAMGHYRDLNQNYVAPNDGHNDVSRKKRHFSLHSHRFSQTNQYLPQAHSHNGTVCISLPGYTVPSDSRVVAAITEPDLESEFPFQRDMNTGNNVSFITVPLSGLPLIGLRFWKQIGVGWIQATIANGERCSSATTYVGPAFINRPNLHILLHAQATKLLEATDHGATTPRFNGVEFGTGPSSKLMGPTGWIVLFTGYKAQGGR